MGVQEKKATAELESIFSGEDANRLKTVLNNPNLSFSAELFDGIEANGIRIAATGIEEDFLPVFLKTCEDNDYREEVAKISSFVFKVIPEINPPAGFSVYTNFVLNGDTLDIIYGPRFSPSSGDLGELRKYFQSLF